MNSKQLKQKLLKEARKDKLLTFLIYLTLYLSIFGLFFAFILSINQLAMEEPSFDFLVYVDIYGFLAKLNEDYPSFIHGLFIILLSGTILFPLYYVKKLTKPNTEIDRLIHCLESGAKAHTIEKRIKYKIIFNIGNKEIRMIPVKNIYVIMNNDNRPFLLPIRNSLYRDQIKSLLAK